MAYPSLTFPNLLDNATKSELELFISLLQGYLSAQHDDDGAHTDITADSLVVEDGFSEHGRTFRSGEWVQMYPIDPSSGGYVLSLSPVLGAFSDGTMYSNHYTMVGNTLLLTFEEESWGISGNSAYIKLWLPKKTTIARYRVKRRHRTYGYGNNNGAQVTIMFVGMADEDFVRVYREDLVDWTGIGIPPTPGASSIFGQWHGEVY